MDKFDYTTSLSSAISEMQLNELDIDYIIESINDQLENLFTCSRKNYLKIFNKNIENSTIDPEELTALQNSVYSAIIDKIADKLQFKVDKDNMEYSLKKVTKDFYNFFVIHYIENVTNFFDMYIIENRQNILDNLDAYDKSKDTDENPEYGISLILNNISETIAIIYDFDITFEDFLYYINKHPDSFAAVGAMIEYDNSIMSETDVTMDTIFKSLIDEDEGFSTIYVNLQTNLYKRFLDIDLD